MPFWKMYYHLVWATRDRAPLIQSEVEPDLYAYLIRKASELDVCVYAINGWVDHVHLIVSIPPHHSVAEVVKLLKGASSHDLKLAGVFGNEFAWQRGYGVLTLGERQRKDAEAYVLNQKVHHQQASTNAWLERETVADEGPGDLMKGTASSKPAIHEDVARYVIDDPLF
jgi:putative transposase